MALEGFYWNVVVALLGEGDAQSAVVLQGQDLLTPELCLGTLWVLTCRKKGKNDSISAHLISAHKWVLRESLSQL